MSAQVSRARAEDMRFHILEYVVRIWARLRAEEQMLDRTLTAESAEEVLARS